MFAFERQNVIAAVAVLVLFGVRSWLRPDPPPSFHVELARVAAQEREMLNRYSTAVAQFKAGKIDDARFAEIGEVRCARALCRDLEGDQRPAGPSARRAEVPRATQPVH